MPIDEELLKPSREYLALLRAEIESQRALAESDIKRYGYGSREYARQRWDEFHMATRPMYREIDAVVKTMVDYYAAQPLPQIVIPGAGQPPTIERKS